MQMTIQEIKNAIRYNELNSVEIIKDVYESIKQMQRVQFSIIKCYFYTRNGVYRRGYTPFYFCFILFYCIF